MALTWNLQAKPKMRTNSNLERRDMHIAIVSGPWVKVPPKKYGGTERVIYHQIKGLIERGHDVTLLATGDSYVPGVRLIPISDKELFFGMNKREHDEVKKKGLKIEREVSEILKKIQPDIDIIHSHSMDLIDFQEFPNLTTLHGKFTLEKMDYFEKRKGLYYVSISENQQSSFPDLNYVGVVYNGLDPTEFPVVMEPDNYLCFIGRFDREKNPHMAIELALHLGMKIKLAGKRDYLANGYWEELIEPHLSNPLVEYLGEIEMSQKVELISRAKCNLHPTGFREPFGLTVLESAYCGTPTLAISRGSMPELIEDGRTGKLVEDYAEGAHVIQECFEMDRRYISERSRLLFNYKNMAEGYEKAYDRVMDQFLYKPPKAASDLSLALKVRRLNQRFLQKAGDSVVGRPSQINKQVL